MFDLVKIFKKLKERPLQDDQPRLATLSPSVPVTTEDLLPGQSVVEKCPTATQVQTQLEDLAFALMNSTTPKQHILSKLTLELASQLHSAVGERGESLEAARIHTGNYSPLFTYEDSVRHVQTCRECQSTINLARLQYLYYRRFEIQRRGCLLDPLK